MTKLELAIALTETHEKTEKFCLKHSCVPLAVICLPTDPSEPGMLVILSEEDGAVSIIKRFLPMAIKHFNEWPDDHTEGH
jgi:hypothetical protein